MLSLLSALLLSATPSGAYQVEVLEDVSVRLVPRDPLTLEGDDAAAIYVDRKDLPATLRECDVLVDGIVDDGLTLELWRRAEEAGK